MIRQLRYLNGEALTGLVEALEHVLTPIEAKFELLEGLMNSVWVCWVHFPGLSILL